MSYDLIGILSKEVSHFEKLPNQNQKLYASNIFSLLVEIQKDIEWMRSHFRILVEKSNANDHTLVILPNSKLWNTIYLLATDVNLTIPDYLKNLEYRNNLLSGLRLKDIEYKIETWLYYNATSHRWSTEHVIGRLFPKPEEAVMFLLNDWNEFVIEVLSGKDL